MHRLPLTPEQVARYGDHFVPVRLPSEFKHNGQVYPKGETVEMPATMAQEKPWMTEIGSATLQCLSAALRGIGVPNSRLGDVQHLVAQRTGADMLHAMERLGVNVNRRMEPGSRGPAFDVWARAQKGAENLALEGALSRTSAVDLETTEAPRRPRGNTIMSDRQGSLDF